MDTIDLVPTAVALRGLQLSVMPETACGSVDLFRAESVLLKSYWVMVVMDVFTRRIVGFGVAAADLDGIAVCQLFNRAIARKTLPEYLSSDHDPLFRFQCWRANLRVLEIDELSGSSRRPVADFPRDSPVGLGPRRPRRRSIALVSNRQSL
jgi:hypothetical protein